MKVLSLCFFLIANDIVYVWTGLKQGMLFTNKFFKTRLSTISIAVIILYFLVDTTTLSAKKKSSDRSNADVTYSFLKHVNKKNNKTITTKIITLYMFIPLRENERLRKAIYTGQKNQI